jgi:multiple sugar transport system permease protein
MSAQYKAGSQRRVWGEVEGWLWASPWVIGVLAFTVIPMALSFYWSFTSYEIVNPSRWIGLQNYISMLSDPFVAQSLGRTFYYAGVAVPLGLILGLGLALLVNQNVRGISFWRTIYYLPAITAVAAYARLWQFLLDRDYGLINNGLALLGIKGPTWFSPNWIIPAYILMSIWTVGGSMIVNLAGLQSVPTELYDAAKVDGATGPRLIWNITLPMISPVIFYNLVMGIIGAMQSFAAFYILTGGGGLSAPSEVGMVYMLYLYRNAFLLFRMGYGCALAWLLFLIILILTIIVFRSGQAWVHYEGEAH